MFLWGPHTMLIRSSPAISILILLLMASSFMLSGCRLMNKDKGSEAMAVELQKAPPIRLDALDNRHMLVMQAHNPGWTIELDRDERGKDAWTAFITIKRPNPAFMYPQQIVEKRLLTDIETTQTLIIMARLLDHDQPGTRDQYAPLTPVDSFAP